jgi:hypothetical protein
MAREEPSTPATAPPTLRSSAELSEKQEAPQNIYLVFARDGKNETETKRTEQFLRTLVGKENVRPPFVLEDVVRYWLCDSK